MRFRIVLFTFYIKSLDMKKIFVLIFLLESLGSQAQFKYDGVKYATVFPKDLCSKLSDEKNYLLLDVRSREEFADSASGLNIGHLKDALNINISELGKRIKELERYKNLPIFIYCSHSQRSRRASRMLADSGFTRVININGGMTAIHQLEASNCGRAKITSNSPYAVISAQELMQKLSNDPNSIFLLDVRSDSAFRKISLDAEENAMGYFTQSVHIPYSNLEAQLKRIPADKEIVIIDLFGDDAYKAADMLYRNGHKKTAVLLEGIERLLLTDRQELPGLEKYFQLTTPFGILSSVDFERYAAAHPELLSLDVRTTDEFNSKHADYWRNIGHMVNAINIPVKNLEAGLITLESYKNKPVVVYAFSGNSNAYDAAYLLSKKGFSNVQVLAGGIFNIRWTAANSPGHDILEKWVTDIPEPNR